jgi:hypothetical protein
MTFWYNCYIESVVVQGCVNSLKCHISETSCHYEIWGFYSGGADEGLSLAMRCCIV